MPRVTYHAVCGGLDAARERSWATGAVTADRSTVTWDLVEVSPLGVVQLTDSVVLGEDCRGMDAGGSDVLLNLSPELGALMWLDPREVRLCELR
jgi:hypothetical protein